ncbi:MAG: Wzz/FepE/Etk N-terminal domain-containing protein [Thiolinea sp.]
MQVENNPYNTADDEIDLRELVRTLIRRKKTILLVASLVLLASVAYAFLATPVYKAKATFLPPTEKDLTEITIPNIYQPNPQDLYEKYSINLESRHVYQKTFNDLNIAKHYNADTGKTEAAFEEFIRNISIVKRKNKKDDLEIPNIYIIVTDNSQKMSADIANYIAEQANNFLANTVIKDIYEGTRLKKENLQKDIAALRILSEQSKVDQIKRILESDMLKVKEIEDQITALRATAKAKRLDEIEQLKEADQLMIKELQEQIATVRQISAIKIDDHIKILNEAALIAKKAGIIERSGLLGSDQPATAVPTIYTEINTQDQPLYLRGEKALTAEAEELKKRKSDDSFIPELRDLQKQIELLKDNQKIKTLLDRKIDDPFIPELRDLQKNLDLLKNNREIEILLSRENNDAFIEQLRLKEHELKMLENIKPNAEKIRFASFDQLAYPPTKREKPKRSLIVALGAIGGLFLGIIAAFMLNFWQSLRLEDEGKA